MQEFTDAMKRSFAPNALIMSFVAITGALFFINVGHAIIFPSLTPRAISSGLFFGVVALVAYALREKFDISAIRNAYEWNQAFTVAIGFSAVTQLLQGKPLVALVDGIALIALVWLSLSPKSPFKAFLTQGKKKL